MNGVCLSRNMNDVSVRLLVADYVKFRLEKEGLRWAPSAPDLRALGGGPSDQVARTMRTLGEEFERRYAEVFDEMCNQLHITPANAQQTFISIINELFSDGVRWGRVVALFAFGGALSVQCVQREMPPIVDQIVDWVTQYVDAHLQSWIQENGGWTGFVEFYENSPERREDSPWPSLTKICGYAVGAIGMITLGAIWAQKS